MEEAAKGAAHLVSQTGAQFVGDGKRAAANRSASSTRGGSPSRRSVSSMRTVSTLSVDDTSDNFSLSDDTGEVSDGDDTEWLIASTRNTKAKAAEKDPSNGKENVPKRVETVEKRASNIESTLRWMNEAYTKPGADGYQTAKGDELDGLNVASRNVIRSVQLVSPSYASNTGGKSAVSSVVPTDRSNAISNANCLGHVGVPAEIGVLNGLMAGLGFAAASPQPLKEPSTPTHRKTANRCTYHA